MLKVKFIKIFWTGMKTFLFLKKRKLLSGSDQIGLKYPCLLEAKNWIRKDFSGRLSKSPSPRNDQACPDGLTFLIAIEN